MKRNFTLLLLLFMTMPLSMLQAQVLLNEVSPDAGMSDGINDGIVELINTGATAADISCYVISNGEWAVTIPDGTSLAAGDVYLIACSATAVAAQGLTCDRCDFAGLTLDLDVCGCTGCFDGDSFSLDNENTTDGDQVALFNSGGSMIDGLLWSGGSSNMGVSDVEVPVTMNNVPLTAGCTTTSVDLPAAADAAWATVDTYLRGCNSSYIRNIGSTTSGSAASGDWSVTDHPNPAEQNDSQTFQFSISATELCAPGTVTITAEIYNYQSVQPGLQDAAGKYGSYIMDESGSIIAWPSSTVAGGTTTLSYTTGTLAAGTYTFIAQWDDYTEGCCGSNSPTSNNECYERMEYTVTVADPFALTGTETIACPNDFDEGQVNLSTLVSGGANVSYELFDNGTSIGTNSSGVFTIQDTYTGPLTATATNDLAGCGDDMFSFTIDNNCRLAPACPAITTSNFLVNGLACGSAGGGGFSTTACPLDAGTIAITHYNGDGDDDFTFVALGDIDAGVEITFTDNGWNNTSFRTGEGVVTWTVPAGGVTAGTVINIEGTTASIGSATGSPLVLSTSGDQIIAYCGTAGSPSFITALNYEGAATWQASAGTSNQSALPTGLVNGSTAIAVPETDNGFFTCAGGTTSGDPNTILTTINDASNWTLNDSGPLTAASCTYVVTTGPAAICAACPGDQMTLTVDGDDLPEGGSIDWYKSTSSGFDPYAGEGTMIGSSAIPIPSGCAPASAVSVTTYTHTIADLSNTAQELDGTGTFVGTNANYDGFGVANGPTPAAGEVFISQILYDPSATPSGCSDGTPGWGAGANTNAELLELNGDPGTSIGCWVISDGEGAILIPDGTVIPADGVFLVGTACAVAPYPFADVDLVVTSDLITGASISFTNGGDEFILVDASGNIVDAVSYNGGVAETVPATNGSGTTTVVPEDLVYNIATNECNGGPYYIKGIINPHVNIASCLNSDPSATTLEFEYEVVCPEVVLSGDVVGCDGPAAMSLEFLAGTDGADYNVTVVNTTTGYTESYALTAVTVPGTESLTIGIPGEYEIQSFEEVGGCTGPYTGNATIIIDQTDPIISSNPGSSCESGGGDEIVLAFNGADLPVEFTYTIDGGSPITVVSTTETYVLLATTLGTYELTSAVTGIGCPLAVSETIVVTAPTCTSSICGTTWYDGDVNDGEVNSNNGTFDVSEFIIAGIEVNLYTANGTFIATQNSDGLGEYCFNDIADNDYYVEFVYPTTPEHGIGSPLVGSGPGDDGSDADPTTGASGPDGVAFTLDDVAGGRTAVFTVTGDVVNIDAGIVGPIILLPMELLSFTATKRGEQVNLAWKTATETNSDFFSVEKSTTGFDFDRFGRVTAAGTSYSTTAYDFVDPSPSLGANYYRLTLYDKDGQMSQSDVVVVLFEGEQQEILVMPNPANNYLDVSFTQALEKDGLLEVFDVVGTKVGQLRLTKGQTNARLNLKQLPNGNYFIHMYNGKEQLNKQFIKVK